MFCTNCGKEVNPEAVACLHCGLPPRKKNNFCHSCGVPVNDEQIVCVKCGVSLARRGTGAEPLRSLYEQPKNRMTAGLLSLLLGGIGAHKFYLGSWGWGLVYLVFVWTYIPVIVGVVEGIILLSMSDEQFHERYPASTQQAFRW
ncbi:MAG: NINE protein [Trueperaceae bacterium]|nr:NINE protein [Trueperaceae bacterium]